MISTLRSVPTSTEKMQGISFELYITCCRVRFQRSHDVLMETELMSIQWQIMPFVGINELKFGLFRSQVRQMLVAPYRPFKKGPNAFNDTDSYDGLGFHLYYDREDNLEFIEAFSPCDINFEGMLFLGRTLADVFAEAKKRNWATRMMEKDLACYFDEQGIALYIEDEEVRGVSIHPKGYYERYLNL